MSCLGCGFSVVEVESSHASRPAQVRGFCCAGCAEVYDRVRDITAKQAQNLLNRIRGISH